jgi:hypothetical protein
MKNPITALSLIVTFICAWLLFQKNREIDAARARAHAAEQRRDAFAAQAAQEKELNDRLSNQIDMTLPPAEPTSSIAATSSAVARQPPSPPSTRVSDIFRDAAMKEMLKSEAKVGVARTAKALFDAGLADHLHLNEHQADALKQLVTRRASLVFDQILIPMMTGEVDESNMVSTGKLVRAALLENDADFRSLLGDKGYASYKSFEQTQADRDHLKEFAPSFVDAGQALTADQKQQLLAAMAEERAQFKFQFDISDPLSLDLEHWYDNFTFDRLETFTGEMRQLNELFAMRGQEILSPEQLTLFKELLASQLQQATLTMKLTTATFARQP